eukprot:759439-Hanusia_phi.AAC.7
MTRMEKRGGGDMGALLFLMLRRMSDAACGTSCAGQSDRSTSDPTVRATLTEKLRLFEVEGQDARLDKLERQGAAVDAIAGGGRLQQCEGRKADVPQAALDEPADCRAACLPLGSSVPDRELEHEDETVPAACRLNYHEASARRGGGDGEGRASDRRVDLRHAAQAADREARALHEKCVGADRDGEGVGGVGERTRLRDRAVDNTRGPSVERLLEGDAVGVGGCYGSEVERQVQVARRTCDVHRDIRTPQDVRGIPDVDDKDVVDVGSQPTSRLQLQLQQTVAVTDDEKRSNLAVLRCEVEGVDRKNRVQERGTKLKSEVIAACKLDAESKLEVQAIQRANKRIFWRHCCRHHSRSHEHADEIAAGYPASNAHCSLHQHLTAARMLIPAVNDRHRDLNARVPRDQLQHLDTETVRHLRHVNCAAHVAVCRVLGSIIDIESVRNA